MKTLAILMFAIVLAGSSAEVTYAQEPSDQEATQQVEVEGTRSPFAAAVLKWAVPTLTAAPTPGGGTSSGWSFRW